MSLVKQYYHVILQAGDGTKWKWQVTNSYFNRRMEVINREMQAAIRKHDKDNQFRLDDESKPDPLKTFEVVLVNIQNMQQRSWCGTDTNRYGAVAQAFMDLTGKTQGENLETWKVLQAKEIS